METEQKEINVETDIEGLKEKVHPSDQSGSMIRDPH